MSSTQQVPQVSAEAGSPIPSPIAPHSKASAMKEELTILFKGMSLKAATFSLPVLLILGAFTFKQWLDGPIAIRPFTVVEDGGTAGISTNTRGKF